MSECFLQGCLILLAHVTTDGIIHNLFGVEEELFGIVKVLVDVPEQDSSFPLIEQSIVQQHRDWKRRTESYFEQFLEGIPRSIRDFIEQLNNL